MSKSISYAVTVCNERKEIEILLNQLNKYIRPIDEIVVLFDEKNGDNVTREYLETVENITLIRADFNNNFGQWKNKLKSYCKKEYIFFLDADEISNDNLLQYLPDILNENPTIELFWVPRINIVNGITKENLDVWGWTMNDKKYINYPDIQSRICKNIPNIHWDGHVHEKLIGAQTYTTLPPEEQFSLIHIKDIKKQINQNKLYNQIN